MAQFRTTADIKKAVLKKAGEPTNGNSSYDTLSLEYINKAHQAIVGGGSIFSLKVDEDWKWARAKNPMILELEPAFSVGTVTVTEDSRDIAFSSAPTTSKAGWHIRCDQDGTIYKLTQHTAGAYSAELDSDYVGASGEKTFKCFKLDYELIPKYLIIDSKSDKLDFLEQTGVPLSATLTHGSYTPTELIAHVAAILTTAGNNTYTGSYDSVSRLMTIESDLDEASSVFSLLGETGTNRKRSALPVLGFDRLNFTGSASYEGIYAIGGISRMIEPIKIFRGSRASEQDPYCKSNDPQLMEESYPIAYARQAVPEYFTKLHEENDGLITIRFSSYPAERLKAEVNWVPVPHDLQDNDASVPLVPRHEIDVLIHAGAAFILFDKEDTKFADTLNLVAKQLEAMEKKNRSEVFRTGYEFAQIIPRADLADKPRKLRYGYTYEGGGQQAQPSQSFPRMTPVTHSYSDFSAIATSKSVISKKIVQGNSLFALIIKHSAAFNGGSISALKISVGIAGEPKKFIADFDAFQAPGASAQDSVLTMFYPTIDTDVIVTAESTGGNLDTLTQGSVTIYFQELGVSS